jgi:hypothetical protein
MSASEFTRAAAVNDLAHYPLMSSADEPRPAEDTTPAAPGVDTPVISKEPSAPAREIARSEIARSEIGGREGPEPTRYGDWEKNGRCIDF